VLAIYRQEVIDFPTESGSLGTLKNVLTYLSCSAFFAQSGIDTNSADRGAVDSIHFQFTEIGTSIGKPFCKWRSTSFTARGLLK
jgi:hypothetical protein